MRWRKPTPSALIAVSLILSVSFFTHFTDLSRSIIMHGDIGRALLAGRDILQGNILQSGPPTSVAGLSLGPLFYYLTAAGMAFTDFHPLGAAAMVSTFGVGASLLLFTFLRRHLSLAAALFGSLWFSLSPLVILQSRIILEPSPLPFFVLAWALCWWEFLSSKKLVWLLSSILIALLALQLNFSAIILAPIMFLGSLPVAPIPEKQKKQVFWITLLVLVSLAVLRVLWKPSTSMETLIHQWKFLTFPQYTTLAFAAFFGFLWAFPKTFRRFPAQHRLSFALWGFFTLLALCLKTLTGEHAFALVFPLVFIVLGVGLDTVLSKYRPAVSVLFATGLCIALGTQLMNILNEQQGSRLQDWQPMIHAIVTTAQEKPYILVYSGHLDIYPAADDHLEYLLWLSGHPAEAYYLQKAPEKERGRIITVRTTAENPTGFTLDLVEKP